MSDQVDPMFQAVQGHILEDASIAFRELFIARWRQVKGANAIPPISSDGSIAVTAADAIYIVSMDALLQAQLLSTMQQERFAQILRILPQSIRDKSRPNPAHARMATAINNQILHCARTQLSPF